MRGALRALAAVVALSGAILGVAGAPHPAQAAGACLSVPLVFENETVTGCPDADRLAALMEVPLAIGPRDPATGRRLGVALTPDAAEPGPGGALRVRSCRDYLDALASGHAARTQAAMAAEGLMRVACGTLLVLAASKVPAVKPFTEAQVGLETLSMLPPDILPALTPEQAAVLAELTAQGVDVGTMVGTGEVMTRPGRPQELDLARGGFASTYGEVARGDFDGDGAEDLLVYARHAAVEASLRWYELFALAYPPGAQMFTRFVPAGLEPLN